MKPSTKMRTRAVGLAWLLLACGAPPADVMDSGHVPPVAPAAPCASGCSGPAPAELERLGDSRIAGLIEEMTQAPVGAQTLAADTLLFHATEVLDHLDRNGPAASEHLAWLRAELDRDQVEVGFRLVAEDGSVLGWRDDVVPLADKQHLVLRDTGALGRADVNGKVKRVGVNHLWARF